MVNRQSILLTILNKEVRPALGCTGPVAVAFAAAAAKDTVGGEPKKVRIVMDKDSYIKNVAVGIPGIDMRGIEIAASLGAIAGVSSAGLEVLKDVTPSDAAKAKAFLPNVDVKIQWDFDSVGLYIEAWVATDKGEGHVLVGKTHTNIIFRELKDSTRRTLILLLTVRMTRSLTIKSARSLTSRNRSRLRKSASAARPSE